MRGLLRITGASAIVFSGALLAQGLVRAASNPPAATIFQRSVAAMRVLRSLHGDGVQAENAAQRAPAPGSYTSYHAAGDCAAQRTAAVTEFTLTGAATHPTVHIGAQYTMVFPYGRGDTHIWKRPLPRPAGSRPKTAPWIRDDQDHTALIGGFLCPTTLIQQLQANYPRHLKNLGAQTMDGRPCWHLRSVDLSAVEPGVVTISDYYVDRTSLRWVRTIQVRGLAPNAPTTPKYGYTRSDFHYSRFNEAVRIVVP